MTAVATAPAKETPALRALLKNPFQRKLLVLGLAALVLVPSASPCGAAAVGPPG